MNYIFSIIHTLSSSYLPSAVSLSEPMSISLVSALRMKIKNRELRSEFDLVGLNAAVRTSLRERIICFLRHYL